MSKGKFGCLAIAVAAAIGMAAASQTETGKAMGALVLVYGGAIVAGAVAYDQQTATVVEVRPSDHPTLNGLIKLAYVDADGGERIVTRNALGSRGQLDGIRPGDRIAILVCKRNPESVRVPSLQLPGGPPCRAEDDLQESRS
jgi:hypothetical protein